MKTNNNNNSAVPNHIEDEDLIAFLDGEIDRDLQTQTETHLESCWDCRGRLSNVERSIENFLQLRQDKLLPRELPPPGPALELFRTRLTAHSTLVPSHSLFKLRIPNLLHLFRRISCALNIANYSLKAQVFSARVTAAVILVSIITGFILLSGRVNKVSASELLRLSIEAEGAQIAETDQPVLYQRIHIRTGSGGDRIPSVTWEIWNDTVNGRVRTGNGSDRIPVVADLRSILRSNRMNEHRPLSASSYKSWSDSLASKTEEVTTTDNALTIITVPDATVALDGITEARLVVRASDYHPTEFYIRAKTALGEREFELIEQDFAVVSLKDVDPAIFADLTTAETASTVGTKSEPGTVVTGSPDTVTAPAAAASIATAELEVEVLNLLHSIGADLGEQIEVKRMPNGPLHITGVVETTERRNQILIALSSVAANPAIRIQISTAAEEIARQKQQKAQPKPSVETLEVESSIYPAEADVRAALGDNDQAVRQFASRTISRSSAAMNYLWAMKRLKGQFSTAELAKLTPEGRAKWLNVIRSHASSYQREIAALKRDLQPVFGGGGSGEGAKIASDAELMQAIDQLFAAGSSGNQFVRQAFTTTSSQASTNALRTGQFWRLLNNAEALANSIATTR